MFSKETMTQRAQYWTSTGKDIYLLFYERKMRDYLLHSCHGLFFFLLLLLCVENDFSAV